MTREGEGLHDDASKEGNNVRGRRRCRPRRRSVLGFHPELTKPIATAACQLTDHHRVSHKSHACRTACRCSRPPPRPANHNGTSTMAPAPQCVRHRATILDPRLTTAPADLHLSALDQLGRPTRTHPGTLPRRPLLQPQCSHTMTLPEMHTSYHTPAAHCRGTPPRPHQRHLGN